MSPRKLPTGIDKLPSGKYRVRVPVEKLPSGKWRYASGTFSNLKDAESRRQTIVVAKQTGRAASVDDDLVSLAEFAADHMAAERAHLAAATYGTYRALWQAHVVSDPRNPIADMSLRAITPTVVEKFRDERLAAGAGPESVRKVLMIMQSVFNRAVRDERVSRNPVLLVRKPPTAHREGIVPTTLEEVERLRAKLDGADAVMVSILAYGGLRPGEARGLKWADIGDRVLHVRRAVGPEGVKATKTTKTRTVPLSAALRADLEAWWKQLGSPPEAAFVLSRSDGEPWSTDNYRHWRKRAFAGAATAAGVKIARPYDLRHSAASLWIAEGRTIVEVAAWLGHAPTMTLKTYAHVVADRRDIPVTYERVRASQTAGRRRTRKRRKRSVSAASV